MSVSAAFYGAARALHLVEARGTASGRAFPMLGGEVCDAIGDAQRAEAAFATADRLPEG